MVFVRIGAGVVVARDGSVMVVVVGDWERKDTLGVITNTIIVLEIHPHL